MGFMSFVKSFIINAFEEDLNIIIRFPMLPNSQISFTMHLFCYAQCPSYLLHIEFPFLGIL